MILLGWAAGGGALIHLLRTSGDRQQQLRAATWMLTTFWLSMAGSILFPNMAQADPDFADLSPRIAGIRMDPSAVSLLMFGIIGAGYSLEQRRMLVA